MLAPPAAPAIEEARTSGSRPGHRRNDPAHAYYGAPGRPDLPTATFGRSLGSSAWPCWDELANSSKQTAGARDSQAGAGFHGAATAVPRCGRRVVTNEHVSGRLIKRPGRRRGSLGRLLGRSI